MPARGVYGDDLTRHGRVSLGDFDLDSKAELPLGSSHRLGLYRRVGKPCNGAFERGLGIHTTHSWCGICVWMSSRASS